MYRGTRRAQMGRVPEIVRRTSRRAMSLGGGTALVCAIASCVGTIGQVSDEPSPSQAALTSAPSGSSASSGSSGSATSVSPGTSTLLPARIRRLSNAEFDATTHSLLGTSQTFASTLPADVRQGSYNAGGFPAAGFTRNAAAVFDAVSAPQIGQAADALAAEAVKSLSKLAPCSGSDAATTTSCATAFIASFGPLAYRRPLTADETTGLLAVYQTGAKDQSYSGGIQLVITTILQSAGFLYLTELGGTPSSGATALTSYEVASSLSYFLTGGPPDATLMQAASADALRDPAAVGTQASRLLKGSTAQLAAFVEQWLGVDSPPGSSTGTTVTGAEMASETTAYIEDVMTNGDGSLGAMLLSPTSFVDGPLATLYGLKAPSGTGFSKVSNPQRPGLLNQASFLSTYAHSSFSAPIKRGHLVRTQMLCVQIPPPSPGLMVNVSPPLPTGVQTTREADVEHMTNGACVGCHSLMDPIGWGFENFDGNGAYRTTEAGMAIDASGGLNSAAEITGPFANNAALIAKLASSTTVGQCYLTHFADFAAATSDPAIEASFMNFWHAQSATAQTNLPQLVIAFVQSDMFLKRATP